MKKRSFFQRLFGDKKAEKAFEKRMQRIERNQQTILRLLQRQAFKDSGIIAPEFASTGLSFNSMEGEDGHLLHIFNEIGVTNRSFLEFGVQDGMESNTANLAFNYGWGGVLIEGNPEDAAAAQRNFAAHPRVTVKHSFVTKDNIVGLMKETGVNMQADLFSLDIDGNDYWIWDAMAGFSPRVVVAEYNPVFGPERTVTIPYTQEFRYGKGFSRLYFGASLAALTKLARRKGYVLVGCADFGPNAFYVRADQLKGHLSEVAARDVYRPIHLKLFTQKESDEVNQLPLVDV